MHSKPAPSPLVLNIIPSSDIQPSNDAHVFIISSDEDDVHFISSNRTKIQIVSSDKANVLSPSPSNTDNFVISSDEAEALPLSSNNTSGCLHYSFPPDLNKDYDPDEVMDTSGNTPITSKVHF